eukprot:CAMPEP_0114493946 /NCGR_PEP_ID=MMETSP0109-20121206/4382_1 /TAXON_ID=29199 /ORGANISM="Chlorarachnion reptans, Strain CCCM449" /LENGTH=797 /DNA_ID=CAMNT_0001670935 /DNA_START=30 /DNA_END=2423 /DNA_ORIENTATION=-
MWRRNKKLLALNLLTNYVMPLISEMLPWYLCVRRISKRLRLTRTSIEHSLVLGRSLDGSKIIQMAVMTVLYSALHNLLEILRNRNHLESQLLTRRLVLEKILFSEIGAVESRYETVFGETVRAEDMEEHVFRDVSDTVILFEVTIPSIIRGAAELLRETYELYTQRNKIDLVALFRPFALNAALESINLARWRFIGEKQEQERIRNRLRMAKAVSNICEGLADVQVNNIQAYQLRVLDNLTSHEIEGKQGTTKYLNMVYETIDGKNVVDFISEAYVAHWVMRTRGITHEIFTNIRNEILHVVMAAGRLWRQIKKAAAVMDAQHRVVQLLDLDMFSSEEEIIATMNKSSKPNFRKVIIRQLFFGYNKDAPDQAVSDSSDMRSENGVRINLATEALNSPKEISNSIMEQKEKLHRERCSIGLEGESELNNEEDELQISTSLPPLIIERGKTYLVVGRNRSGKSTLMKVLCKILRPQKMDVEFNGGSFSSVDRVSLRRILSYVPQRPFIFEGTIAENINLGRYKSEQEMIESAAEQAGVFLSEAHPDVLKAENDIMDDNSRRRIKRQKYRPWARRATLFNWFLSNLWASGERVIKSINSDEKDEVSLNYARDQCLPLLSKSALHALEKTNGILSGVNKEFSRRESRGSQAYRVPFMHSPDFREARVQRTQEKESGIGTEFKRALLSMRTTTRGTNLSGGFAQSVAMARVFLKPEAQIVILDEALSQMDAVKRNHHVLPRLFRHVKENNQTLIMVTHDVLSVAKQVDHIFVMDGGRCVHQGTHADLVRVQAPAYMSLIGEH